LLGYKVVLTQEARASPPHKEGPGRAGFRSSSQGAYLIRDGCSPPLTDEDLKQLRDNTLVLQVSKVRARGGHRGRHRARRDRLVRHPGPLAGTWPT